VQHAPFLLLIFSVFELFSTFFLMVVVVMFHQDERNLAVAVEDFVCQLLRSCNEIPVVDNLEETWICGGFFHNTIPQVQT
jgi:hypothetical protein